MDPIFGQAQRRLLQTIFELGAAHASTALSQWLHRPVRLTVSAVDELELADAVGAIGPEESPVVACSMDLGGMLSGELLLVFEEHAGLALTDFVLGLPHGTAVDWGELEQSAALETANIVGCAFLNTIGSHLPGEAAREPLIPSPPSFKREFAGSLLQFALMDQAVESDRVLMVRSCFSGDEGDFAWWLLFVPRGAALVELGRALGQGAAP